MIIRNILKTIFIISSIIEYLKTFKSIPHEYITHEIVERSVLNGLRHIEDPSDHKGFIPEQFYTQRIKNIFRQVEINEALREEERLRQLKRRRSDTVAECYEVIKKTKF